MRGDEEQEADGQRKKQIGKKKRSVEADGKRKREEEET